ncbi:hypothetical protein TM5383_01003 [Thalassovita mediterranea]|jgi:hypothetical protein|uniref:Uncharacterized protein n=1 Tax=Thalassovita mediterranea TaxID=340021 RepID=A0A0P1GNA9_9RHOB|nr:hypothetical protein TM5383_01003 [Thalassovita mediterranea]SIS28402.1 hypothetical protein SAMN05421685_101511 [Thalassovita mediterranea]
MCRILATLHAQLSEGFMAETRILFLLIGADLKA